MGIAIHKIFCLGSGSVPSLTLSEAAAAGVTLTAAAACLGGSSAVGPVVSSEGVGITPVRTDPSTTGGLLSPNNTVVTELEPPPPLASFSSIQPTAANATAAGTVNPCRKQTSKLQYWYIGNLQVNFCNAMARHILFRRQEFPQLSIRRHYWQTSVVI